MGEKHKEMQGRPFRGENAPNKTYEEAEQERCEKQENERQIEDEMGGEREKKGGEEDGHSPISAGLSTGEHNPRSVIPSWGKGAARCRSSLR